MSDQLPAGAEAREAIVWFPGYREGHEFFAAAAAAGGFVHVNPDPEGMPRQVYPAEIETRYLTGRWRVDRRGVQLGVDVVQGCWVVDVPAPGVGLQRVRVNLRGGMRAVELARQASGLE